MPSYTPEHRRAVLKGLRILARVAIRSYRLDGLRRLPLPGAGGRIAPSRNRSPRRMAARKRVSVECKRGVQAVRCGKKVRSECGAF